MESSFEPMMSNSSSIMEKGYGEFGCSHYRRRCKIRAPCCDEIFDCRHCHNESKNSIDVDPLDRHEVPRYDIKRLILLYSINIYIYIFRLYVPCVTENKMFSSIALTVGFAWESIFVPNETSSMMIIGGEENFFHCNKCGCCYSTMLKNSHNCVEKAMHHTCAVCFEFLFDTTKDISVLPCGHTIPFGMCKRDGTAFPVSPFENTTGFGVNNVIAGIHVLFAQNHIVICPGCGKDLTKSFLLKCPANKFQVASTAMPQIYQNKMFPLLGPWLIVMEWGNITWSAEGSWNNIDSILCLL
ncbi:hypothetical protein CRYUN_Cryun08bG0136800 [Craigia yunnanensis]